MVTLTSDPKNNRVLPPKKGNHPMKFVSCLSNGTVLNRNHFCIQAKDQQTQQSSSIQYGQ